MPAPTELGRLPANVRLSLFYAALFTVPGITMPFWPVWLAAQGVTATQIGIISATGSWVRVLINPMVGNVADRLGQRRLPIIVLAWATLAAFSLFGMAEGFAALLAVSILFGLMWSPIMPLSESLTLLLAQERRLDYARIRLWGSISFLVVATLAGAIIEGRTSATIFVLALSMCGINAAVSLLLPNVTPPDTQPERRPLRRLLTNSRFFLFLGCAGLAQASHAMLYGFSSLHWRAAGHSETVIGLLWAEGVVAEILLFVFGATMLRRLGPLNLLLLAAAAGILRWTATGLSTDLAVLVLAQALHALTFGAAHLGAMHYIAQNVAPSLSATAQSLYAIAAHGVALSLAMLASGVLFATFGGYGFLAMTLLSGASAIGVLLLRRRMG